MPRFTVDHVTIAASRLEAVAGAFAAADLETDYGGQHSNAATHMSLLGFDDGSYIELVSVIRPGLESPWWHEHIVRDMGPCAWAVRVDDVAHESERLRSAGVRIDGPHAMHRRRPDGETAAWDLAYVGEGDAGAMHPFIIADRADRSLRARPSASSSGSELEGIACVVLGVADAARAASEFGDTYGLRPVEPAHDEHLGVPLSRFDDPSVVIAMPASRDDWLARRVSLLGASPCAFLMRSSDLERSRERFALTVPAPWGSERVCWFDGPALAPLRLGVVGD